MPLPVPPSDLIGKVVIHRGGFNMTINDFAVIEADYRHEALLRPIGNRQISGDGQTGQEIPESGASATWTKLVRVTAFKDASSRPGAFPSERNAGLSFFGTGNRSGSTIATNGRRARVERRHIAQSDRRKQTPSSLKKQFWSSDRIRLGRSGEPSFWRCNHRIGRPMKAPLASARSPAGTAGSIWLRSMQRSRHPIR